MILRALVLFFCLRCLKVRVRLKCTNEAANDVFLFFFLSLNVLPARPQQKLKISFSLCSLSFGLFLLKNVVNNWQGWFLIHFAAFLVCWSISSSLYYSLCLSFWNVPKKRLIRKKRPCQKLKGSKVVVFLTFARIYSKAFRHCRQHFFRTFSWHRNIDFCGFLFILILFFRILFFFKCAGFGQGRWQEISMQGIIVL